MKKELLVSVLTAIMAMGSSSLHAQAKLVVTPLNGGQTGEYALTDIQKITFGEDGMHVVGSNFEVEPLWKLSTIKNLQFVGLTDGIGQLTRQETGKLTISLRENLLTVHGIGSQPALATIYDISGQIVLRAKVADGESIDASALSNGIFIIRVNNKTLKFVKQ